MLGYVKHLAMANLIIFKYSPVSCSQPKNMRELQEFDVDGNELSGSIPSEFGTLMLTRLYLGGNNLSGTIPYELFDLSNLITLTLDRNELTGTIPEDIERMSQLTKLQLCKYRIRAANFSCKSHQHLPFDLLPRYESTYWHDSSGHLQHVVAASF